MDQARISECEIDNDCGDNNKCCGSEFSGISKCVFPASPEDPTEAPFEYDWDGAFEYDYAESYGNDGSDDVEPEDAEFGIDQPAYYTDFLDGNDEEEASVDNSGYFGNGIYLNAFHQNHLIHLQEP